MLKFFKIGFSKFGCFSLQQFLLRKNEREWYSIKRFVPQRRIVHKRKCRSLRDFEGLARILQALFIESNTFVYRCFSSAVVAWIFCLPFSFLASPTLEAIPRKRLWKIKRLKVQDIQHPLDLTNISDQIFSKLIYSFLWEIRTL